MKPIDNGSLGLRYLHHMNLTSMAKLVWRLIQDNILIFRHIILLILILSTFKYYFQIK